MNHPQQEVLNHVLLLSFLWSIGIDYIRVYNAFGKGSLKHLQQLTLRRVLRVDGSDALGADLLRAI